MAELVKPRAASTILLLRDAAVRKEIEVFMMVRHYEIDFNSGALVFPGDRRLVFSCGFRSGYDTLTRVLGTEGELRLTGPISSWLCNRVAGWFASRCNG